VFCSNPKLNELLWFIIKILFHVTIRLIIILFQQKLHFVQYNSDQHGYPHLFTRYCTPLNTFLFFLVTSKELIVKKKVHQNDKHGTSSEENAKQITYLRELDRTISSTLTLFLLYKAPALKRTEATNKTTSKPIHHVVTHSQTPAPMSKNQPRNRQEKM
jgi:hypothetical protein